jgi:hypothetical protein
MSDTSRQSVTLVYIPEGHSEPEEKAVYTEGWHDLDSLVDAAVDDAWRAGDEPIEVRDWRGHVRWTNSRFGDLS